MLVDNIFRNLIGVNNFYGALIASNYWIWRNHASVSSLIISLYDLLTKIIYGKRINKPWPVFWCRNHRLVKLPLKPKPEDFKSKSNPVPYFEVLQCYLYLVKNKISDYNNTLLYVVTTPDYLPSKTRYWWLITDLLPLITALTSLKEVFLGLQATNCRIIFNPHFSTRIHLIMGNQFKTCFWTSVIHRLQDTQVRKII